VTRKHVEARDIKVGDTIPGKHMYSHWDDGIVRELTEQGVLTVRFNPDKDDDE
jgi:hypothetical protein